MKKILLVACGVSLLSGCATLFADSTKRINIVPSEEISEPVEIKVSSSGGVQNITLPSIVSVPNGNSHLEITVKETSCIRPSTMLPDKKVNILFIGNYISTTGATTDAATGDMWTYEDNIYVPVYKKESCEN